MTSAPEKKILIFGAGKIGRSFIGQLFSRAGYELVFIDANKDDYLDYYRLIFEKVPSGGYILVDNVLWGGKVFDDPTSDSTTIMIQRFNEMITEDLRVENYLLPIRDGLMVIKKL